MPKPMTMELWNLDAADYPADKTLSDKLDFLLNYAEFRAHNHKTCLGHMETLVIK